MRDIYFKCGEGIGGNVERGHFDVAEKVDKVVGVEHDLGEGLVAGAFPKHGAAVECDLVVLVAAKRNC